MLATWFIGPRVPQSAYHLLYDLRERLAPDHNVQITTDGFAMYLKPVHSAFVGQADYAQLQKIYGAEPTSSGGYSPAQCMGTRRTVISGNPDPKLTSIARFVGRFCETPWRLTQTPYSFSTASRMWSSVTSCAR